MTRPAIPKDWKVDTRPARFGWAPGDYVGHCRDCGEGFIGAKRSPTCADCAYATPDPQPRVPCFMFGDLYGEFS